MKRLLIGTAISLAMVASAAAADMPVYKKAPVIPVYSWTGFYIGGNVGYSWGPWDSTNPAGIANFPGPASTASPKVTGWLGGLQAGQNWQQGNTVLGLEGDIQITGERASNDGGSSTSVLVPFNPNGFGLGGNPGCRVAGCTLATSNIVSNSWKLPWFSTFRGRLGMTADPTLLLYVTGGLAVGAAEYANATMISTTFTRNDTGAVITATTGTNSALSERVTRAGIAVGGGIEKAFDRNWSAKAEYIYLDFGTHTFLAGTGFDTSVRLRDHIARIGINRKLTP
jgi:outer membrane immunogenic protein